MLDVQTAYNMDTDHLIQALRCENLGPKATMMLETIEELHDERIAREDELEHELDQAKDELKAAKPLLEAMIEDYDTTIELLECLEAQGFTDPVTLGKILVLLKSLGADEPDQIAKLLVAVKVLQELKNSD